MARDSTSDTSIRRWLLAAVLAAVAMLAWLSWHAIDASVTVGKLADSAYKGPYVGIEAVAAS